MNTHYKSHPVNKRETPCQLGAGYGIALKSEASLNKTEINAVIPTTSSDAISPELSRMTRKAIRLEMSRAAFEVTHSSKKGTGQKLQW